MIVDSLLTKTLVYTLIHSLWQAAILGFLLKLSFAVFRNISSGAKYRLAQLSQLALLVISAATFTILVSADLPDNAVVASVTESIITTNNTTLHENALLIENSFLNNISAYIDSNSGIILNLWLAGITFLLFRYVFRFSLFGLLSGRYSVPADDNIDIMLRRLCKELKISTNVSVKISDKIAVPGIAGLIKPVIIMPSAIVLSAPYSFVEAALVHELIHLKKYDLLTRAVQTFIEVVFFFNPFVHMISSTIDAERENNCDDEVIKFIPKNTYANALAYFAGTNLKTVPGAINLFSDKYQLINRITRIIGGNMIQDNTKLKALLISLLIFAGIAAVQISAENSAMGQNSSFINEPEPIKEKSSEPAVFEAAEDTNTVSWNHFEDDKDNKIVVKYYDDNIFSIHRNGKPVSKEEFSKYEAEFKTAILKLDEAEAELAEQEEALRKEEKALRETEAELAKMEEKLRKQEFVLQEQSAMLEKEAKVMDLQTEKMDSLSKKMDLQAKKLDQQAKLLDIEAKKLDIQAKKFDLEAKKLDEQAKKLDMQAKVLDEQAKKLDKFYHFVTKKMFPSVKVKNISFSPDGLFINGEKQEEHHFQKAQKVYKDIFGKPVTEGTKLDLNKG